MGGAGTGARAAACLPACSVRYTTKDGGAATAAAYLPPIFSCLQGAVAEGVLTSRSAHHLAQKKGIECPVIEGIYRVRA